jgi:hypothetical protein
LERSHSNVAFVTIAVFKLISKDMKKTRRKVTSKFFLKHTLAGYIGKKQFQCNMKEINLKEETVQI